MMNLTEDQIYAKPSDARIPQRVSCCSCIFYVYIMYCQCIDSQFTCISLNELDDKIVNHM